MLNALCITRRQCFVDFWPFFTFYNFYSGKYANCAVCLCLYVVDNDYCCLRQFFSHYLPLWQYETESIDNDLMVKPVHSYVDDSESVSIYLCKH